MLMLAIELRNIRKELSKKYKNNSAVPVIMLDKSARLLNYVSKSVRFL